MATADSVFTKVTGDLLNRTILVGHLELIENHVAQFLDIWELSEYPVELQAPGSWTTGTEACVRLRIL